MNSEINPQMVVVLAKYWHAIVAVQNASFPSFDIASP